MTPEELHWLLDYIQENNSWKALLDNQSDRPLVRFVKTAHDVHIGVILSVTLVIHGKLFSGDKEFTFKTVTEEHIEDLYSFLNTDSYKYMK